MMQNIATTAADFPLVAFNPIFEGQTNETIYAALCANTAPLDAGLEELQRRLRPIILSAAKAYLKVLSWTFDNAMGEALILIWDLVRKHSYKQITGKRGTIGFHTFFANVWKRKLITLYEKVICKGPVMAGTIQTGWCGRQPVYASLLAFDPKAEEYRAKKAERAAAYYDRKLAEQGKTRQPVKPKLTEEEKRERERARAAKRFAELTPEQKAEMYAKNNARRRAARAAETPEQKAARNKKIYERFKARKAQQAMEG